jgi:hypothetical protein
MELVTCTDGAATFAPLPAVPDTATRKGRAL